MRHLLLVLIFQLPIQLIAQDTLSKKASTEFSKFKINFVAGPCIPLGDYGKKNLDNPRAGFSLVGTSLKLRLGYAVSKHLFLTSDMFWFYNPIDANAFLNGYTNTHPSGVFDSYKITTQAWKYYGLLAGINKEFSWTDFNIEFRGLVGYIQGRYSPITVDAVDYDTNTKETIRYEGMNTSQIAMNVGINFSTLFTKSIGMTLGGDFLATELRFKESTLEQIIRGRNRNASYSQPVSVLQISAGFFVRF